MCASSHIQLPEVERYVGALCVQGIALFRYLPYPPFCFLLKKDVGATPVLYLGQQTNHSLNAPDARRIGIAAQNVRGDGFQSSPLTIVDAFPGQLWQWESHHRKVCKVYNQFVVSAAYQALPPHERLDAMLLSHLIAEVYASKVTDPDDEHPALSIFLSLRPLQSPDISAPPVCQIHMSRALVTNDIVDALYSRFGNNNFAIHSHLTTFAHGIFPVASKLFNHSCLPNAAAKYIITPSHPVRMEVVALSPIDEGEEICISYVDPLLVESRQQIFQISYGFTCTCPSCEFLHNLGRIPDPPTDQAECALVEKQLRDYVFSSGVNSDALTRASSLNPGTIPHSFYCLLHESYIARISENFSRASHEGPYDVALEAGTTLLALYALIYPLNYPQIGMHLLEMAKTAWNAIITGTDENRLEQQEKLLTQVESYIESSEKVLMILAPEGDEGGPIKEVQRLKDLLEVEKTRDATRS